MTSYVLTLIGNPESSGLESDHIKRALQCLELSGETHWLAEEEACDIFIDSGLSTEAITAQVRDVLAGYSIDIACTLNNVPGNYRDDCQGLCFFSRMFRVRPNSFDLQSVEHVRQTPGSNEFDPSTSKGASIFMILSGLKLINLLKF